MNEHSIFLAALEISAADERAAWLDEACGDDRSLRKQVESLLAAHERSDEFLEVPVIRQIAGEGGGGDPAETSSIGEGAATDEIDLSFLEPSPVPGSPGRLQHYEVREVIGRGGCGIVLKAFDEKLERIVAIKVMAPELAATSPARKRFLREARATAAIRHGNVVSIHAVEEQPLPFLVMEYIDGETLQQRLDRTGPLELPTILRIGRQIADGLAAAHAKGLIHRDIKPGNILLERGTDDLKITDFGLVRSADDASMTQSGVIVGTPLYMSPEQAQARDIDHRTDLFSLGSVLYVMCSGRPPFRASSTLAVMKRVVEDQPRPVRGIIPEVPEWLIGIIAKLHAKTPELRFGAADEVAELLARCATKLEQYGRVEITEEMRAALLLADGEAETVPGSARQDAARNSVGQSSRSNGRRWWAAAVIALVLFGGLGITEATGVTDVGGTVIRLFSPAGTLIVEVDDPAVGVTLDGEDVVITGTGTQEIRLKPGQYRLQAMLDGEVLRQELVTVTRNGRQVVRLSRESDPGDATTSHPDRQAALWVKSISGHPLTSLVVRQNGRERKILNNELVADPIPAESFVLTGVNLQNNRKVTDAGLANLQGCDQLTLLNLGYTSIGDEGLAHLKGCCRNLRQLHLPSGPTDDGLSVFRDCRELTRLSLHGTRATTAGLENFRHCKRLTSLFLGGMDLARVSLECFYGLASLESLDLRNTGVDPPQLVHFRGCRELQHLDLSGNPDLTNAELAYFRDCTKLTWLNLAHADVDADGLAFLVNCRDLTYLNVAETHVSNAFAESLSKALPDCTISRTPRWPSRQPAAEASSDSATAASASKQADTVERDFLRRNPGFLGVIGFVIQEDRIVGCRIAGGEAGDLAPLSMLQELQYLEYDALEPHRDAPLLRGLANLETINGRSAETFRLAYPAGRPDDGVDARWLTAVRALPAEKQRELVRLKLKEHNPSFAGRFLTHTEDGQITALTLEEADVLVDLSPVQAFAKLRSLTIRSPRDRAWLTDLSPLRALPLTELILNNLPVRDLTPLAEMPLTILSLSNAPVTDLSALKNLPLKELDCREMPLADLSPLRGMSLERLLLSRSRIDDLSPLAGMPLKALVFQSTQVSDLSPLKGMPLTHLNCVETRVSDLSPLKGMPLETLSCGFNGRINDLSPLKDMPLVGLWCQMTAVEDLSPLKGLPLVELRMGSTRVSDLSPLKGMRLTHLHCADCPRISDLSPLAGMPLTFLHCDHTQVSDLAALKKMPLESLTIPDVTRENLELLRDIESLREINGMPVVEFWKTIR